MDNNEPTSWLLAKIASVWSIISITSWSEAAGFIGFIYTAWLLSEKIWRSVARPLLEKHGYLTRKART